MTRALPDPLWERVDAIPGWLTRRQAEVLRGAVQASGPAPVVVEIGSHQGRSTVVLAGAVSDASVTAVDPFITARLFSGPEVRQLLMANLDLFGVSGRVTVRTMTSREARSGWVRPIDVLYIDGKHDYWTVTDDLGWVDHVQAGGHVLIHDAFSSVGVTLALLLHVLPSEHLTYVDRSGSLALFTVSRPRPADRLRMMAAIPWWLRNIAIKVLLRLRLHRVARTLGHESPYDPY